MVVFAVIFIIFFNINQNTSELIHQTLLEEQLSREKIAVKNMANHVESDLKKILEKLKIITVRYDSIQDYSDATLQESMTEAYIEIDGEFEIFSISLSDKDNIIRVRVEDGKLTKNLVGTDSSTIPFVKEVELTSMPSVSNLFMGLDGNPRIAISYPVISQDGEYLGQVRMITAPNNFFEKYGNIAELDQELLIVLDRQPKILTHPMTDFIGEEVFGEKIRKFLSSDDAIMAIQNVVNGEPDSYVYTVNEVERLAVVEPVFLDNVQVYSIILTVPTQLIYSKTENIFLNQQAANLILLFGISIFSILMAALIRNQSKKKEKLLQLSAIGELSAKLSHDLRNPLNVLSLGIGLIKKHPKDESKVLTSYLPPMEKAVDRMKHQVEHVLDFVKANPLSVKKDVSLIEILKSAINNIKVPKNIHMTLPQTNEMVNCDPYQIQIVFENLLVNAFQAIGKENGEVTVRFIDEQNLTKIEIKDSGPGISKEILPKIFDVLFSKKLSGTGLGLVSCKTIIEKHGGTIRAGNIENEGAVFTFTLPKK